MIKLLVLAFIFLFGIVRWMSFKGLGKTSSYMLISLFVQTLPFGFGKAIYVFLSGQKTIDDNVVRLGEFDNAVRLEMPLIFTVLLFLLGYHKFKKNAFSIRQNKWFYILLLFCVISSLNPYNKFVWSFLPMAVPFIQFFVFFKFLEANFSRDIIMKGIYDGLVMVSLLQFFLAICYPVLGLESIASIFRGENALEWSQRRGLQSAIGTFTHPGHLAIYSVILLLFFTSCLLNKYKKNQTKYLIVICAVTLGLTFARTAILCGVIATVTIFFINKYGIKAFSIKNVLYSIILFVSFVLFVYLSPWGYLFFESDSNIQVNNRLFHWILGYQIWQNSRIIGIGINTHVYYMLNDLVVYSDIPALTFFLRSPIHNIHMIILAELGVLGFTAWIYFIFSSLKRYINQCKTILISTNVINLSYLGIMIFIVLYGFFGWSPFIVEIYSLCFLFGYFSSEKILSRRVLDKS